MPALRSCASYGNISSHLRLLTYQTRESREEGKEGKEGKEQCEVLSTVWVVLSTQSTLALIFCVVIAT